MRDDPDAKAAGDEVGHGEGHPVDRDATFADHVTQDVLGGLDIEAPIGAVLSEEDDLSAVVDMARHEVSAHPVGGQQAGLKVDHRAWLEVAEVGQAERLGEQVEAGAVALGIDHGQAAAVGRDAVAGLGGGEQGVREGQAGAVLLAGRDVDDLAGSLD
ncbi:MAG: hypothetical protein RI910_2775 [Verrucomicrobiota bacterium]